MTLDRLEELAWRENGRVSGIYRRSFTCEYRSINTSKYPTSRQVLLHPPIPGTAGTECQMALPCAARRSTGAIAEFRPPS